jgi:hypothetical protein
MDETKRKTQERMERRSGKRSSSTGSEKMERIGDREKWRGIVRQNWREWRRMGCLKRSSLKNWYGRDEEEDPGKDGAKK